MALRETKCKQCGCSNLDRNVEDWDDYDGLCPVCSYAKHEQADAENFLETLDLAEGMVEAIQQRFDEETRLEFVSSVRREALELFVEADDENDTDVTSRERRIAARLATNLAKLLIMGAPSPVISNQFEMLRKRIVETQY